MLDVRKIFAFVLLAAVFSPTAFAAETVRPSRTSAELLPGAEPLSSCPRRSGCSCEWKVVDGILWCWPV